MTTGKKSDDRSGSAERRERARMWLINGAASPCHITVEMLDSLEALLAEEAAIGANTDR